ncbi:B3 domain-containing protein Os05g0481400 [Linum perenne]
MEDGDFSRSSYDDDDAATLSLDTATDADPELVPLSVLRSYLLRLSSVNCSVSAENAGFRHLIPFSAEVSGVICAMSSHAGKCISCDHHEAKADSLSTPKEVKSPAMIRAEEVQANLDPDFPSFLKYLVRSHVGSCFWMGLPGPFCRANLPLEDTTVTLEDEDGKEFNIKYIGYKTGLSAGWRLFCVAQNLLEGDVLVFQLVGNCRFRVYIIRANDLAEVDGALGLLNLDAQTQRNDAGKFSTQCSL